MRAEEIIGALELELKRVTKLKDGLKNDVHILTDNSKVNVNLIEEVKSLKEDATFLVEEIDTQLDINESLNEMIELLIDEIENPTKAEHTFRLIEKAKDLIYY